MIPSKLYDQGVKIPPKNQDGDAGTPLEREKVGSPVFVVCFLFCGKFNCLPQEWLMVTVLASHIAPPRWFSGVVHGGLEHNVLMSYSCVSWSLR